MMGGSLEAGKLIGASYLYRYWEKTQFFLKAYLIAGITTLMLLTSVGIFGYLSSGYQADVLPLKQAKEQVNLLENERTRAIERKKQIDDQISKGPVVSNVQRKDGELDPNAARTLREATKARESINKQFTSEQQALTKRIVELDKELLTLKQTLIQTEAKIGPISYIAGVFDLPPDNATKYLILLIIFAFDPMALALTLAVNIALRDRAEQKAKQSMPPVQPATPVVEPDTKEIIVEPTSEPKAEEKPVGMVATAPKGDWNRTWKPMVYIPEPEPEPTTAPEPPPPEEPQLPFAVVENVPLRPSPVILSDQNIRLTPQQMEKMNSASIKELVAHFKTVKAKDTITPQEAAELREIERIFERRGLLGYLQ